MTEEWREIPGFEDRYEISDMGRVRSVDRIVEGIDGRRRFHRSRMMTLSIKASGYQFVALTAEGKSYIRVRLSW